MKKLLVFLTLTVAILLCLSACSSHEHSFGEWEITKNPTCTEDGIKARFCDCGEKQSENIAAIGHNYIDNVCTNCSLVSVASCKHDDATKIIVCEGKNATCQQTGLTQGMKCTLCDTMVVPQMLIPTTECTDLKVLPYQAPTCQETGLTEGKQCNICGSMVTKQEVLSKINCIESGWIIDKAATKTEDGAKHTECIMCGTIFVESIIPAVVSVGLKYEINTDGETCTITGIGTCTDNEIVIPTHINGYKVVTICDEAFYNCNSLTSIVIPDSVTTIGECAFYYCSNLSSVVIPDSVATIGDGAFAYCYSLSSIEVDGDNEYYKSTDGNLYSKDGKTLIQYAIGKQDTSFAIPDSVTTFGYGAFAYCDSLTSIVIPESVTTIVGEAFFNCNSLSSVVIPDSVTTIDYYAFYNCDSLTSIVIPDSVATIGYGAFYHCSNLSSVVIPDSVTTIGNHVFYDCHSSLYTEYEFGKYVRSGDNPYAVLIEITNKDMSTYPINENTRIISSFAFSGCSRLTSIVIPDGVATIGGSAFSGCDSLTSIVISDSVTTIGNSAFSGCDSLSSIEVDGDNEYYKSTDGDLYSKDGKTLIQYAIGKQYTSFAIPNSVTTIAGSAFYNCDSLTSIVIPENVTSIGNDAFYNCDSLTSIVIPDSVTTIGDWAFRGCSNLSSVVIGDSVTTIGNSAFSGCDSLISIEVNDDNEYYKSIDGNLYSKDGKTLIQYAIGKQDTSFAIPDSVTIIDCYAFAYCDSLTSIVIPDSVTTIGERAFYDCSKLSSVVIPDSVTTIGDYAFCNCGSLTSIVIPNSVTTIGYGAFFDCDSLSSVVIGNSVTTIGYYAFDNCSSLTDVYYTGSETEWQGITIGSGNSSLTNKTIHYNYVPENN